jgi:rubrerythrin
MSENLKKLRGKEIKQTGPTMGKMRKWITRDFTALSGMANIEELEHKAAEARKEEEQVKKEISETAKEAVKMIMCDLDIMIQDEERAVKAYNHLLELYGTVGWRKTFLDILNDEKEHLEKLKIAKKAVEDEMKKYV